jgi:hypothetical protein
VQHGDSEVRQLLHPHPQHHWQGAGQHLIPRRSFLYFWHFSVDLELWFWSKSRKTNLNKILIFEEQLWTSSMDFLIWYWPDTIYRFRVRSPKFIRAPCAQLYSLAEPPPPAPPPPRHLGSYTRALLVSQYRRHLSVPPGKRPLSTCKIMIVEKTAQFQILADFYFLFWFAENRFCYRRLSSETLHCISHPNCSHLLKKTKVSEQKNKNYH